MCFSRKATILKKVTRPLEIPLRHYFTLQFVKESGIGQGVDFPQCKMASQFYQLVYPLACNLKTHDTSKWKNKVKAGPCQVNQLYSTMWLMLLYWVLHRKLVPRLRESDTDRLRLHGAALLLLLIGFPFPQNWVRVRNQTRVCTQRGSACKLEYGWRIKSKPDLPFTRDRITLKMSF